MTISADDFLDAVYENDLEKLSAILTAHPHIIKDQEQMCSVVQLGSTDALALMIRHGAPVVIQTDDGFPLLHIAIDRASEPALGQPKGGHDILRVLLESGANVNERGMHDWTPLHRAAAFGDLKSCRILLDNGADPTETTNIDHYATAEEEARHMGQHAAADLIQAFVAESIKKT